MFIIVPLIIIVVSAAIAAVIILRKFPYLKKLPAEAAEPETGVLESFAPEIYHFFNKMDLNLYQDHFLKEIEKFLRRLRVVSLRLDHFTKHMIDKIRTNGSRKETVQHLTSESARLEEKTETVEITKESLEDKQKKEEHALIIEIAKNPKNPELYKKLADIYIFSENFSDAAEALKTALKLDPEDKKTEVKLRAVQKALPT